MAVEIVTKDDLQVLRKQLMEDFKAILTQAKPSSQESQEGYKTKHVRKLLGCSNNKLVSLRIARKLRTKKVGGTIYYNKEDVKRLLEEGY
jgi:hypothetical protein